MKNPVAKHLKINKPKTHRDKKKDYNRKEKVSFSYLNFDYKHPDV